MREPTSAPLDGRPIVRGVNAGSQDLLLSYADGNGWGASLLPRGDHATRPGRGRDLVRPVLERQSSQTRFPHDVQAPQGRALTPFVSIPVGHARMRTEWLECSGRHVRCTLAAFAETWWSKRTERFGLPERCCAASSGTSELKSTLYKPCYAKPASRLVLRRRGDSPVTPSTHRRLTAIWLVTHVLWRSSGGSLHSSVTTIALARCSTQGSSRLP